MSVKGEFQILDDYWRIGGLVLSVLLPILANAFFAAAEIAIISVRRTRIRQLVEEGNRRARVLQDLIKEPHRFLATIQIGITLTALLAASIATQSVGGSLKAALMQSFGLGSTAATTLSVAIFTLVVGYLTLVIGEITPKSVALKNAERWALFFAGPIHFLSRLFAPAVWVLSQSSGVLIRPFGGQVDFVPQALTEDEIRMAVAEASEMGGELEEEETEMIHNVFEFTDTVAREVMIPRIDMTVAAVDTPLDELLDVIISEGHSRIPIFEDTVDNIIGIVHAKDLLKVMKGGKKEVDLHQIVRPAHYIPENKKVDELLKEFKASKAQLAIVVDEYGGTAGLVTAEDLIEEIVGDILDEYDVEEQMVELVDANTAVVDARMPIDELNELMSLRIPEDEFETVGGFVFGLFGKLPTPGESITYDGVRIVVEKVDNHRIARVRVIKHEEAPKEAVGE